MPLVEIKDFNVLIDNKLFENILPFNDKVKPTSKADKEKESNSSESVNAL